MNRFYVKAILDKKAVDDTGIDWVKSQKGYLIVNSDEFQFNGLKFKKNEIISSRIRVLKFLPFIQGAHIRFETSQGIFHFGLTYTKRVMKAFSFINDKSTGDVSHFGWRFLLLIPLFSLILIALYFALKFLWAL